MNNGQLLNNGQFGENLFHGRLRAVSGRLFWLGLAMVVLGLAAIIFPMVATLAAAVLVGWVLLVSGILVFAAAFSIHGTGPFFGALLSGLLSIGAGVFLLHDPFVGAMILTLVAGIIFMLQGAFELVFAIEMRPSKGWVGMLISGIFSIAIALMIIDGWPSISSFVLGILLGVNFLTTGIGFIATSKAFKP
jgi:uncharacterized membrane protein HdeD (DUF308 family)